MRLLDWMSSGVAALGRGAQDGRRAAAFVRHTLRGNRVQPAVGWKPSAERRMVLLLHGYLATRGSLHLLERRLAGQGQLVLSYPLGFVHRGDICESAARIAAKIEAMAAQVPLDRLDIVGHSMGGLVGLYYVKRMGGRRRVRRLVMLGTPTCGTWSALLGIGLSPLGRAGLQLLPDSAFLRELEEGELPAGVDIVSVSGARDRLAPPATTRLPGVRHVCLPTNHAGLLVDEDVARAVGEILASPAPTLVPPPSPEISPHQI